MQSVKELWPFHYLSTSSEMEENKTESESSERYFLNALYMWESKLMILQSLLIWENPKKSMSAFIFYSALFWLIALVNISVITKLSIIFLVLFMIHEWVTLIWPEISVPPDTDDWTTLHVNIMSVKEISVVLENIYIKIIDLYCKIIFLRRHKPGLFCSIAISLFFVLFTIGSMIPGHILLYIIITFLVVIPGMSLHYSMPSFIEHILKFCYSYVTKFLKDIDSSEQSALDEYVPNSNEADLSRILNVDCSLSSSKRSSSSSLSDSFKPVAAHSHMEAIVAEIECQSEAEKFENQLIAGLSAKLDFSDEEVMEKVTEKPTLTWYNKALYMKTIQRFLNNRSTDNTSSSDSS